VFVKAELPVTNHQKAQEYLVAEATDRRHYVEQTLQDVQLVTCEARD
jgi:hypothetical protein